MRRLNLAWLAGSRENGDLFTDLSRRGGPNAAGELERLFAPLAGFMSDLSLAGGNADEIHPPESSLAA
jgi:hypothetical protein